jgi:hypothetical protein
LLNELGGTEQGSSLEGLIVSSTSTLIDSTLVHGGQDAGVGPNVSQTIHAILRRVNIFNVILQLHVDVL